MDSTSPVHHDDKRWPVGYEGENKEKHSLSDKDGEETSKHITDEILKQTKKMLQEAYQGFEKERKFNFPKPM